MPQASIDPVVMAAATVMRLQTIVSRELAAAEAAVVTIGSLQAGTKENVIPDEAVNENAPAGARSRRYFCLRAERCDSRVKHRLDLFGILVLSFAAGNAGGIARDLLIGAVPPAAISDWRYLAVSLLAGIVTFWRPAAIDRLRSPVLLYSPRLAPSGRRRTRAADPESARAERPEG